MTGSHASGRALAAELVENRNPRSISGLHMGWGGADALKWPRVKPAQKRAPWERGGVKLQICVPHFGDLSTPLSFPFV
jgi:hypothetical protein